MQVFLGVVAQILILAVDGSVEALSVVLFLSGLAELEPFVP